MNIAAILRKQYRKRASRILALLEKPVRDWSMEDIHSLRVEMKKLIALAQLVKAANPDFHRKKMLAPYIGFFDQAGQIRDIQLHINLLNTYELTHALPGYLSNAELRLTNEMRKLQALICKAAIKKIRQAEKAFTSGIKKVSKKKALAFLTRNQSQIEEILVTKSIQEDGLHELRKQIKNVMYLSPLLMPNHLQRGLFDPLQERIGQWHDLVVIRGQLEKVLMEQSLRPEERTMLENLVDKLQGEIKKKFEAIQANALWSAPSIQEKSLTP